MAGFYEILAETAIAETEGRDGPRESDRQRDDRGPQRSA
jgi:hypothetical protein